MERQFANKNKVRDPRWLRLDVCRDHTRGNKCERGTEQCRFAHPDKGCVIMNGKVTACYDSMKGRCNRDSCKFYHPPDHIKKNIQALGKAFEQQRMVEEQGAMDFNAFSMPVYLSGNGLYPRRYDYSDKLPICGFFLNKSCKKTEEDCQFAHPPPHVHLETDGFVTVCMDFVADHCERDNCKYFHPPAHLKARVKAVQLRHAPVTASLVGDNNIVVPPLATSQLLPVLPQSRPPPLLPSTMIYQQRPAVYFYNMPAAAPMAYTVHDVDHVDQQGRNFVPVPTGYR